MSVPITREAMSSAIQNAVESSSDVFAMCELGSTAMGRADALSDLDILLLVADGSVERVLALAEAGLREVAPLRYRHSDPEPAWHGHSRRHYQLEGAGEHLKIDLLLQQLGTRGGLRLLQSELHGVPVVVFNKLGRPVLEPVDWTTHRGRMHAKLAEIRANYELYGNLPMKELTRGRLSDAIHFGTSQILRPLVDLLRMRHDPRHFDWGMRYLDSDLPRETHARLMPLFFSADAKALLSHLTEARSWLESELAEIDVDAIDLGEE